jgi:hypothetical protein
VARRPLKRGEELAISYVDASRSRTSRQTATTEYGFLCACARCADALSDDDQTSEEEEEEDWETDDDMA